MARKKKLSGMMTIEITPFNKDGTFDEVSYKRELDHILKSGMKGMIAGGHISEGSQMPFRELMKVWKTTFDYINGKIPVGVGTLSDSLIGVTDLVKQAQDIGADFTMTPPGKGPLTPDQIYEFYSYIASKTDIPIMLYDSAFYVPLPPATIMKLVTEFSNFCYVKAEINVNSVFLMAEEGVLKKADVLCGQEQYLMPHLQDGAIGGTNSVSLVAPKLANAVFKAAEEKNWTLAWTEFRKLWPVMMALYNQKYGGWQRPFKETLHWMGIFDSVNFCSPVKPLTEEQKASLRKTMLDAGVELVR
jgi:dihydrodipicolinate synthase/N-acetylneuraminate lyase